MKCTTSLLLGGALLLPGLICATPLGTAFTYQGRLAVGTNLANGSYHLAFSLHDAAVGGSQIGLAQTNYGVAVSQGYFKVTLDFGSPVFNAYDGNARWLAIAVAPVGGAFTPLTPRQELTPAPYALYTPSAGTAGTALSASSATTAGTASQVASGGVSTTALQDNAVTTGKILDGTITSADLSAPLLGSTFWRLAGNAGTTVGTHFVGTTDDEALDLKVNNQRALRLTPTTNAPNLTGGYSGNYISNAVGAVIGGGGAAGALNRMNSYTSSLPVLFVQPHYSVIGGGSSNQILGGLHGTIAGGRANHITGANIQGGNDNTIGGGAANVIANAFASTIAGGRGNALSGSPDYGVRYSTIGGGYSNNIYGDTDPTSYSTIGGGFANVVQTDANDVVIGGGLRNNIGYQAGAATIAGGAYNSVSTDSDYAAIGGGNANNALGQMTTIGGGQGNRTFANYATAGGGQSNRVESLYGTVPGGTRALARAYGQQAYASGNFAAIGDAQSSLYVVRATTTTATETELFLDGAAQRLVLPTGATWTFDVLIAGRSSTGSSAGYHIRGTLKNVGGTVTLVGAVKSTLAEDVTAWDANVTANDTTNALEVRVVGAAATTIRWVAHIQTAELIY